MAKKKGPNITLTDRVSKKSASLNDPQAVRLLLTAVVQRLIDDPSSQSPTDATDQVAGEIIAKTGGAQKALDLIADARTIQVLFAKTSLEGEANETPTRGDAEVEQVPLPRGKDLEKVLGDMGTIIAELWPILCARIEKTEGDVSQTITPRITWNPPTENRDGYIGVSAAMAIQGAKITRTGAVAKKKRGGFQFCLFDVTGTE